MLRGGRRIVEQYWDPYRADDRALVYSASKTFTATAVGLAIGEGRLNLTDRLVDLLPDAKSSGATASEGAGVLTTGAPATGGTDAAPSPADPVVAELTVHHLLSMSTGHDADTLPALESVAPAHWARTFLSVRPQAPVGSRHVYNNGASWLLGELVRRHTGTDLLEYLRPRLLEPLGIEATWDTDSIGRQLGWTGIHLTTGALAAMGELYRCDGVWKGRRLLPQGWVARATTRQIPTEEPNPDWNLGYGYQLWMGREGYRLDGAYGQFSLVLPERGLVIAITSAQSCTQVLLDLVWDVLLPELETLVEGTLVEPVETRLPVPADDGGGAAWRSSGPVALDESMAEPEELQFNLPAITDLQARRDGAELRLAFTTGGSRVELVTAAGQCRRQLVRIGDVPVPVAFAAGAAADGNLNLRLVFTDTPHTLRLRIGADGRSGQAWRVTPLQSADLADLRAH